VNGSWLYLSVMGASEEKSSSYYIRESSEVIDVLWCAFSSQNWNGSTPIGACLSLIFCSSVCFWCLLSLCKCCLSINGFWCVCVCVVFCSGGELPFFKLRTTDSDDGSVVLRSAFPLTSDFWHLSISRSRCDRFVSLLAVVSILSLSARFIVT